MLHSNLKSDGAKKIVSEAVLLVVGWHKKLGLYIHNAKGLPKNELPPGFTLSPEFFLDQQVQFAHDAAQLVDQILNNLILHVTYDLQHIEKKKLELSEKVTQGKLDPSKANYKGRTLSEKEQALKENFFQFQQLLRTLRNKEEVETPDLPLFHFSLTWLKYQSELRSLEISPSDATRILSHFIPPLSLQILIEKWRGFQTTDKYAIVLAVITSLFIFCLGFFYVHSWGKIDIQTEQVAENVFRVLFVNHYPKAIILHVPYDGKGLPSDETLRFGVLVSPITSEGNIEGPAYSERLWTYKHEVAYRFSPIIVSPMTSEELYLNLSEEDTFKGAKAIQLQLYKPKHRLYSTTTIKL